MSDSTPKEPEASSSQAVVTDPAPAPVAEGPTDTSFGEQNLSFTTTDLNLVEMTEIEYTQLQHILYSHMEAQANENEAENRLNLNCFSTNNPANQSQYMSSCNNSQGGFSSNSSGNQSLYPIICQSGLTSDSNFMGPNQCLGHIDFQELRMMLLSESSLPPNQAEKTPNTSSADISAQSFVKVKHSENLGGINKENALGENSASVPESRAKSAVRVRLEDRFNSIQTDLPRCQEAQETGVAINNLVTLIRHPSEVMGVPLHQQQNKCTTLVKNKTAATTTTALQFTCPLFNPNAASPATGNTNPSQTQVGPPGPPGGIKIGDIRNTSVVLTWSRGTENHSPISNYTIQSRTFLSEYWKNAKTDPPVVEGNAESARVIDLTPWMEYEFRIMATNILGTGEPSIPSQKIRTDESPPIVIPSEVGGGGGSNRELTITWVPLPREYHFGNDFGYVIAFKSFDQNDWKKVTVTQSDVGRYIHKDESMPPSSKYQVKVRAFNNRGNGPFSLPVIIYSAEDAPTERPRHVNIKVRSSTEATVSWQHISNPSLTGYQIRYWSVHEKEIAANKVQVSNKNVSVRLENLKPDTQYHVDVAAFNSAGIGPTSSTLVFTTEKAPPRQKPNITGAVRYGSKFLITWDHVRSQSNESSVKGYKVLYRPQGQYNGTLYVTGKHYIEVPAPVKNQYVVEVRAHSEGGDGEVAQVLIPGAATGVSPSCLGLLLPAIGILAYLEF